MNERYELAIERIRSIVEEETISEVYRGYFQSVAKFILEIHEIKERLATKPNEACTLEELQRENHSIYRDVTGDAYETSYANPSYAALQ